MPKLYQYNGIKWIEIAKNGENGKNANEEQVARAVLSKIKLPDEKKINCNRLSTISSQKFKN